MAPVTLFSLLALAGAVAATSTNPITAAPAAPTDGLAKRQVDPAATSPLPLTSYHFEYDELPYKINPFPVGRGPQFGFNQCNSTTEGPDSNCQSLVFNSLDDFCVWGGPEPNSHMGDIEAKTVMFCTKKGWGGRIMPAGTITGAHFIRTSAYIQITGRLNQEGVGLDHTDTGGELDPHGQDLLGNPIGGVVYSNNLPGANGELKQVMNWNNFVGNGLFCFKVCDNTITSPNYCENRWDLIGCEYNMPGNYEDNSFTQCDGDLQDVVGVYTGADGQTTTWEQTRPVNTIPYTPRIPASSQCRTFSSAELYGAAAPTSSAASSGASAAPTGSASGSGSPSTRSNGAGGSPTRSTSSPGASATGEPSSAMGVRASGVLAVLGAVVGVMIAA
jgi:hypothetical protein